jgi:hypothetical protein
MKLTKAFSIVFFTFLCFFIFSSSSVLATEKPVGPVEDIELTVEEGDYSAQFVNDFRSRKKNVRYSTETSNYRRVSDDVNTYGAASGTITANRTTTFNTAVSGSVQGLNINTGVSVSSSKSYSLTVGPNRNVYLGYRVVYDVEKGTRETYDVVTGRVISTNTYTVKKPRHGGYKLIDTPR